MHVPESSRSSTQLIRPVLSAVPTEQVSIAHGIGLAHDAGNLLGALGLYCDLLELPGVLRPEHAHYARELRLLTHRSGTLINRLLADGDDLSRNEQSSAGPAQAVDPGHVVQQIDPLLHSLVRDEATLSIEIGPGLPSLPFDSEVLERILVNLTRNAATALIAQSCVNSEGPPIVGEIRIELAGSPAHLCLTVTDNGPGMSASAAASFLNPPPQAPGARRGFGHRVIHELVETTGGKLRIDTALQQGTRVQIEWPVPCGTTMDGLRGVHNFDSVFAPITTPFLH